MTILVPVIFLITYLFIRKVWFHLRKIRTVAGIEKISLCLFEPDVFLPEIRVQYKYYFQGGVYYGSGFMLLADFLSEEPYTLRWNRDHLPVLEFAGYDFVSEEQIEHLLLQRFPSILVYIDPVEPFHSQIDSLNSRFMSVPT